VGGLKKPGLIRLRRFALLEITAASVLQQPDFPVSPAHNCPDICQNGLFRLLQPLHKRIGSFPQEDIDQQTAPFWRKQQVTQAFGSSFGVIGGEQHASQFGQPQAGTTAAMHNDRHDSLHKRAHQASIEGQV